MPRAKEFDYHVVLNKAMTLFWHKGYYNTSMQELVETMGINRFSVYATFQNKQRLFELALDHYRSTIVNGLLAPIEQPTAAIADLHTFFSHFIEATSHSSKRIGCLICNTAIELAQDDNVATEKVQAYLHRVTETFESVLARAKQHRKLASDFDIFGYAEYLTGVMMGLFVYMKSGLSKNTLERYIATALKDL